MFLTELFTMTTLKPAPTQINFLFRVLVFMRLSQNTNKISMNALIHETYETMLTWHG